MEDMNICLVIDKDIVGIVLFLLVGAHAIVVFFVFLC